MSDDPILAMLDAVIGEMESAASRFVAIDVVDLDGDEQAGLAEFHRRAAVMRAGGVVRVTDRLVGTVLVDPPPIDPTADERAIAAHMAAAEARYDAPAPTQRVWGFDRPLEWPRNGSVV